jgi:histidine phosphotransferase ChpT
MTSTPTISSIDLASLLCSRLCHDLLSPVGAMNNGIELLEDEKDPEMRARCLDLLADSARTSAQKLKYFRLAFGAAGGFGDLVDCNEPKALVQGLVAEKSRIELGWNVIGDQLPKPAVKILLNIVLIAVDALVRGGELTIAAEQTDGRCEIAVRASGPKIALDDTIARALSGKMEAAELSPRTAAAYMIEQIAHDHNGAIQIARDDSAVTIGAMLEV